MDHKRFIEANADGYPVAFGEAADLRLMETFQIAQRSTIVVTVVCYEISEALMPIIRKRYPHLVRFVRFVRFVAVESDEEKRQFTELGMYSVINRSIPKGLDLAAAVLKAHHVSDKKIAAWMQQRQNQALQAISSQEAIPVASWLGPFINRNTPLCGGRYDRPTTIRYLVLAMGASASLANMESYDFLTTSQ